MTDRQTNRRTDGRTEILFFCIFGLFGSRSVERPYLEVRNREITMNLSKTKVMTNIDDDAVIKVGDDVIERVDSYIYLGHKLKLCLDNQTDEEKRRIGLGWAAFGKLRLIFKSKMNNSLKRKVFDSCVLPVLTYGAETLTLTKASENKLRVTQRAMER